MIQKLRPYLGRIVLILALVIGVSVFLNLRTYGWVEISVPKDTPGSASYTVRNDNNQAIQEVTIAAGSTKKVRVKTGLVRVDSRGGAIQSIDMVRVSSFGTTKLTAPKGKQHAIKQLASGLRFCPLLAGQQVYSYDCQGEGPILKHNEPRLGNTRNTAIFDERAFAKAYPTKDGLIAWMGGEESESLLELFYVNPANNTFQKISIPAGAPSLAENQPDVVVPSDPSATRFALVYTSVNKVYLFNGPQDTSPILIQPKRAKTTDTGRITRGSFWGDELLLYLGTSKDINEGEGEIIKEKDITKTHLLLSYDMSGKETQVTYLPQDISAQGMYKVSDDFYLAQDNEGYDFYHREDNGLRKIYSMTGMASFAISNNRAYVQNDSVLYEFTPKADGLFSLNSLFSDINIRVSRLFSIGGSLYFTGVTNGQIASSTNLYQLLPDAETGLYDGSTTNSVREPRYGNLESLTNGAATAFQATNIQYAIDSFLTTLPNPTKEVLVANIVIDPHDRFSASTTQGFSFDFTLDGGLTYNARVEGSDLSSISLRVYNPGGGMIFDAGTVSGVQPGQEL